MRVGRQDSPERSNPDTTEVVNDTAKKQRRHSNKATTSQQQISYVTAMTWATIGKKTLGQGRGSKHLSELSMVIRMTLEHRMINMSDQSPLMKQ